MSTPHAPSRAFPVISKSTRWPRKDPFAAICSKTRRCFVTALFVAGVAGCGQRVDLGGPSPDPPATDLDGGPPTTLYQFHEGLDGCAGVVVDGEYLYLSTRDPDGPSVHRCRKGNCAATLTRVAGPFCDLCVYP